MKMYANNRSLAAFVAKTETYVGGYVYPGASIELKRNDGKDETLLRPMLKNRVHSAREYDKGPDQPRINRNRETLARCPVGATVEVDVHLNNHAEGHAWKKIGPCKWVVVDGWEWPDLSD